MGSGRPSPEAGTREPDRAVEPRSHGDAKVAAEASDIFGPHLRRRRFAAGSLLWREGETSGLLVAVETGRVKVYRLLPGGRTVTVFIFGPGDVFGFLPFLDGRAYPAYAQALDDVEARVMSRDELVSAVHADPELALALVGFLGQRLRDAMERIERLSTPGVLPRVAAALVALLPGPGDPAGAGHILRLPVTGSEFAAAIGVTAETLSRSITKLVNARILHRLGRGRFQVLDVVGLRQAAQDLEMP